METPSNKVPAASKGLMDMLDRLGVNGKMDMQATIIRQTRIITNSIPMSQVVAGIGASGVYPDVHA